MSGRFRSFVIRPAVTFFVALAVLWGSLFAPSHATAMAFSVVVVAADDHAKPPCPMSAVHHAHHAQMDDETISGSGDAKGMPGDMHCCPALALSPSPRFGDVLQVFIDIPLETRAVETYRFGTPGIELRPPRS